MRASTRAIAVLIALLMAFPLFVFQAGAKETTVVADGIDTAREAGQIVIYTPAYGTTTNTNTWGDEVVIEDNKAVKYSTGNSTIPQNGFVISGHDDTENGKESGNWIRENIKIGDYVYYKPDGTITISETSLGSSLFYTQTTSYYGINVARAENSLVVYNNLGQTTNTNEWGYEVVCEGGYVTVMGGNNSLIPNTEGSFVVSAHGKMVTWLQTNVKVGMRAEIDTQARTVAFIFDEAAALKGMTIHTDKLWDTYNTAVGRYDNFDYTAAKAKIEELEAEIAKAKTDFEANKDSDALAVTASSIEEKASQVALAISESLPVEYRGVWIRPNETSKEEVEELIEKLYKRGINTVCVETLLDCTMIMPMPEDSLFEQDPVLKANNVDLLQAYIDACHARNMEIHIWLPVFYVGDRGSANVNRSVGMKKPEWRSMSSNGRIDENGGYIMLDPSNEEVKTFLLESYRYILENYDIDGFQLDYIRYFERTAEYDMGYNRTAIAQFHGKYGVTPIYNTSWELWDEWVQLRCDHVTDFVRRMRALIDEVAPEVLLGADVVPDPTESKSLNYQDYFRWLEEGLLDIVFPMAYGNGYEEAIQMQVDSCGDDAMIAVGLGIFMSEMSPAIMQEQACYNTSANADGSVYFSAWQYLSKKTGEHLTQGVYRNTAITPTANMKQAALAKTEFAKGRINNVILPLGGIDEKGAKVITSALDDLASTFEAVEKDGQKFAYDETAYATVEAAIKACSANETAKERMLADLKSIVKAYSVQSKTGDTFKIPDKIEVTVDIEELYESYTILCGGDTKSPSVGIIIAICVSIAVIIAAVIVIIVVLRGGKKENKND